MKARKGNTVYKSLGEERRSRPPLCAWHTYALHLDGATARLCHGLSVNATGWSKGRRAVNTLELVGSGGECGGGCQPGVSLDVVGRE